MLTESRNLTLVRPSFRSGDLVPHLQPHLCIGQTRCPGSDHPRFGPKCKYNATIATPWSLSFLSCPYGTCVVRIRKANAPCDGRGLRRRCDDGPQSVAFVEALMYYYTTHIEIALAHEFGADVAVCFCLHILAVSDERPQNSVARSGLLRLPIRWTFSKTFRPKSFLKPTIMRSN